MRCAHGGHHHMTAEAINTSIDPLTLHVYVSSSLLRFPSSGYILRPSFVYGTRQVGSVSLPLALVGKPMEILFRLPPFPSLRNALPGGLAILAPPVSVEAVASVAAAAALQEGDQAMIKAGVLSVDDIVGLARSV